MDEQALDLREAKRRRILYFFFTLSLIASSVICVGLLYAMGTTTTPPVRLGVADQFPVGEPVDVAVKQLETSKLIPNSSSLSEDVIYVVKQPDATFRALLAIDPLQGCFLSWQEAERRYTGSCTGDSYDANGINQTREVASSANPTNMVELPASVRDNVVYIEDRIVRRDIR